MLANVNSLLKKAEAGDAFPVRENPGEIVQAAKDVFLFSLGVAYEKYGNDLMKQQEILGRLADIAIYAYVMESCWLRARKAAEANGQNLQLKKNMATAFIYTAVEKTVAGSKGDHYQRSFWKCSCTDAEKSRQAHAAHSDRYHHDQE